MENQAETLTVNDIGKNIEEWVTVDVHGLPHSVYQKRISGEKTGG